MNHRVKLKQNHGVVSLRYIVDCIRRLILFMLMGIAVTSLCILISKAAKADTGYTTYIEKVCKKDCADPWLMKMAIRQAADTHQIEPSLLMAIFQIESSFQEKAINRKNGRSVGLAQIQVKWHRDKFQSNRYTDIFDNALVGAEILKDCFEKHQGSQLKALWCYNGHQRNGIKRYAIKVDKVYRRIKIRHFFG